MDKSPEAFRTISEVADALDVPPHVLRFWETRFTQVKPVKRGGGRRYYRPEDVRLLRGIRGLLYDDGMTIKGVQKILRERGIRHVIGLGTAAEPSRAGRRRSPVAPPAPRCRAPAGRQRRRRRRRRSATCSSPPAAAPRSRPRAAAPAAAAVDARRRRAEAARQAGAAGAGRRARGAARGDDRRAGRAEPAPPALSPCPRPAPGYKAPGVGL